MTPEFQRAINFVMSDRIEGVLSLDPNDDGNWTGGAAGKGELRGTKYGISAKQYPTLDIAALNQHEARGLYFRDYWLPSRAQDLPPRLGLAFFDFYVNTKPEIAVKALQRAVGTKTDGIIGPNTIAAARRMDQAISVPYFLAERAIAYSGMKNFQHYARGWFRRCFLVAQEASR